MRDNSCFNLLIHLYFFVVLIKVVPELTSVLREKSSSKATTSGFVASTRLFHKQKLIALLGILIGSSVVVIGTIFADPKTFVIIGGSIFFLGLSYSGYCDIRLNQIAAKLTAWGGIILFLVIGFLLLVWGIIILDIV